MKKLFNMPFLILFFLTTSIHTTNACHIWGGARRRREEEHRFQEKKEKHIQQYFTQFKCIPQKDMDFIEIRSRRRLMRLPRQTFNNKDHINAILDDVIKEYVIDTTKYISARLTNNDENQIKKITDIINKEFASNFKHYHDHEHALCDYFGIKLIQRIKNYISNPNSTPISHTPEQDSPKSL